MAAIDAPMVTICAVVVDWWVHDTLEALSVHGDWVVKSVVKVSVSALLVMVALVNIWILTREAALTSELLVVTVMIRCAEQLDISTAKIKIESFMYY